MLPEITRVFSRHRGCSRLLFDRVFFSLSECLVAVKEQTHAEHHHPPTPPAVGPDSAVQPPAPSGVGDGPPGASSPSSSP